LEKKEIKDKLSLANYSLEAKKSELSNIKVNTFSYNPRITELMFEIKQLESEIEKLNKQAEELADE